MIYIYSKYEHYLKYLSENNTDRLYKGLKLTTSSNNKTNLFNNNRLNEEIFNNSIQCDYEIANLKNNHIKVIFKSKNDNEYRIDIFKILENNKIINHIGFTLNNDIFDITPTTPEEQEIFDIEYEKMTNISEIYDILGRIRYILENMVNDKIIDSSFCIGGTKFIKKNKLYEYMLKFIVGDDGFEKRESDTYPKIGWGLYFDI